MKLDKTTLTVLQNFAGINSNLVLKPGNVIKTMAPAKNVMAAATVTETFPSECGIYDLNEFLSLLNLVDEPNLTISDTHANISDNSGISEIKYYFSDVDTLSAPGSNVTMPEPDISFVLTADIFNKLKRASSAMGNNMVSIEPDNGTFKLTIFGENRGVTGNVYSTIVPADKYHDGDYKFILNIANMKLISGDYKVEVSRKLISHMKHTTLPIEYWIALERDSVWNN